MYIYGAAGGTILHRIIDNDGKKGFDRLPVTVDMDVVFDTAGDLLAGCDKVFILLPAKNAGEDLGARDLITMLTKALGQERISVWYAEQSSSKTGVDDVLSQRRVAV